MSLRWIGRLPSAIIPSGKVVVVTMVSRSKLDDLDDEQGRDLPDNSVFAVFDTFTLLGLCALLAFGFWKLQAFLAGVLA